MISRLGTQWARHALLQPRIWVKFERMTYEPVQLVDGGRRCDVMERAEKVEV